jgi:phosphoribosylanthranilate isomerase
MVKVKICGTTSVEDARQAYQAGADFFGVILNHPPSPRNAEAALIREMMRAVAIPLVLLTVNQTPATLRRLVQKYQPYCLQLHGDESPEFVRDLVMDGNRVWKAIHGNENELLESAEAYQVAGAEAVLVDAREKVGDKILFGGTGKIADWSAAKKLVDEGHRVILAGGLNPDNVAKAIETVNPWALDVVSGVESVKGRKDSQKVRDFVRMARKAGQ